MQFRPLTLPFGDAVASLRRSDPPHTDVQTFQFAPESKAALVALIRTIALENKDRRISANTVLPGTMNTPANRAADPKADPLQWVHVGAGSSAPGAPGIGCRRAGDRRGHSDLRQAALRCSRLTRAWTS